MTICGKYLIGGGAVITPGIAALGQEAVERIVQTVAVFDDFCHANDPFEEHDFGSFEAEGETIFLKLIITTAPSPAIAPIQPIQPSPNGSSRSCWPTSTDREATQ